MTISAAWWLYLRSFRRLSDAKWKQIIELERMLPVQPFAGERADLTSAKRYLKGTTVERVLPIAFVVLHVVLLVIVVVA